MTSKTSSRRPPSPRITIRHARVLLVPLVLAGMFERRVVLGSSQSLHLETAIAEQRALVAERGDAAALSDLGNLLTLAGDLDGAEEAYRRAVELAGDDPSIRLNYGLLLQRRGRAGEALSELRRVVELQPEVAWAHYQIGRILAERRQRDQAVAAYARAFELDPTLAFPDTNPHVIENALAAEALLRTGTQALVEPDAAPRSYRDRERISALLVGPEETGASRETPHPERKGDASAAVNPAAPPIAVEPRLGAPPSPSTANTGETEPASPPGAWRTEPGAAPSASASPRSLSERDLRSLGAVNQATPAEGNAPAARTITPRRGAPAPQSLPAGALTPGAVPGTAAPGSVTPPPLFVPGRRSTAQLDLGFRPATAAPGT